jgi:hypothetical protein
VRDRTSDDPNAGAIIATALKRTQQKAAAAKKAANKRGTKSLHGVDNDTIRGNASSRQADGVDAIDRDADAGFIWKRPSNLDAPDPRPGYVQRWIRYRAGNVEDTDNIEKMMDQGWRPRDKSTSKAGHELTARTQGQYGKYYVKRGLMLMEMPVKTMQQRNAFYRNKLLTMTKSVERDLLKENNRVMPVLQPENKTRVTSKARRGNLDASIPDDDEA